MTNFANRDRLVRIREDLERSQNSDLLSIRRSEGDGSETPRFRIVECGGVERVEPIHNPTHVEREYGGRMIVAAVCLGVSALIAVGLMWLGARYILDLIQGLL